MQKAEDSMKCPGSNIKTEKKKGPEMKIFNPKYGFMELTREYVGGAIAGCGVCLAVVRYILSTQGPKVLEGGLSILCIALLLLIGVNLAAAGQRARRKCEGMHNQKNTPDPKPVR